MENKYGLRVGLPKGGSQILRSVVFVFQRQSRSSKTISRLRFADDESDPNEQRFVSMGMGVKERDSGGGLQLSR